jgi:hypothetical protein
MPDPILGHRPFADGLTRLVHPDAAGTRRRDLERELLLLRRLQGPPRPCRDLLVRQSAQQG